MHVETRDLVGAVEHREDVAELLGEVRRHRLLLLQDLHRRLDPLGVEQPTQVERQRNHHPVDFAPHPRRAIPIRRRLRLEPGVASLPATDTEVDAARIEGLEHAETLDHRGGRGVTQLHGGRSDANLVGSGRDLSDQHCGCRAGDADEVMFGDPEPAISPLFCTLGEIDRVVQRRHGVAAGANRRQVENRERDGHGVTFV
jgi:hypothetical protein